MKKQLIISALVAVVATVAQAENFSGQSVTGSWNMSKGSALSVTTTVSEIKSGLSHVLESAESVSRTAKDTSVFVVENPSEASRSTLESSANTLVWSIETLKDEAIAIVSHPVDTSGRYLEASKDSVVFLVKSTGEVVESTAEYLRATYGPASNLVMEEGSGQVFTATSGATVVVLTASKAAVITLAAPSVEMSRPVWEGSLEVGKSIIKASVNAYKASINALGISSED